MKIKDIKKIADAEAEKMLDMLLDFNSTENNIIEEIDFFLRQQENLEDLCYEVDGKIIDFFRDIDLDDESDDDDWPDEYDYEFITAYAYLIKWLIIGDEDVYKQFADYVTENYLYGWLMPTDERYYWWDEYNKINELNVDEFLKISVVYIDRFWGVYKKYIQLYIESNNVDKKILIYGNEDGNKCRDILFASAWNTDDLFKQTGNKSKEEYYKISRNLPHKAEVEVGGAGVDKLGHSIEVISMIKIVLKKRSTESKEYKELYLFLSKTIENMVSTLYQYSFEYEEESYVKDAIIKTNEYRTSYALKFTATITESLISNDLDKILQCKMEMLPIFSKTDSEVVAYIDSNLSKICERIKDIVVERPSVVKEREKLYESLSQMYTKIKIENDIFDTLSTAEYLFQEYIDGKEPIKGWDYSFISILYYQVLEKALNYYVYIPYSKNIECHITTQNVREYLGNANCTIMDKRRNTITLKRAIELGPSGFLLKCAGESNGKFAAFIKEKYDGCSLKKLSAFGEDVIKISKRRNNAAHSCILDYTDAKEDKYIVYCNEENFEAALELRDMVRKLLNILEGKE